MSFSFGGQQQQPAFGGFGQSQPAFGASSSPFGGGGGAFGQQAPAFGASTATGGFGASQPAFGASAPAFGATPSFGGGAGAFGQQARPATGGFGFGSPAPAASPFGASTPAFGASTPAFGAASTPAFGGNAFGAASTPAFGVSSTPAFGATSTPAFGASSSPFGMSAPAFGAPTSAPAFGGFGASSTPAFGAATSSPAFGGGAFGAGGFGVASPGGTVQGTRVVPYQKHQDKDQSGGTSSGGPVYYNTITAMPQYQTKSTEELRWEDYQAGVKNASAAPAPAAGGFGTQAPASGAFGGFGASPAPAFGAASTPAANPFGAPASSPFGGGFGASSGFGAPTGTQFGASTPAFGATSTPSFGGFGASSTPAFGASSGGSLFGGASSAGGFSFGGSTPAFGAATSTPAFGTPGATPSFGGFGASTSSPFGASPASSASPFGTPSPSPFGSSTPAFGATPNSAPFGGFGTAAPASSASTFGGFGSSFGAKPASTPGFGFGASSTPAFGASSPAASTFSFSGAATGGFGSTFGASSTPAFSFSQPTSQPAGTGFNFGSFGSSFGAPAQGAAGVAQAPAQAVPPPGVGQNPYGQLSSLPNVNVPEPRVGISARPARQAITTLRPSPLLTLRSTTPRFGAGPAPRTAASPAASPPSSLALGATSSSSPAAALLPARENPHRLFIREPPPSTTASPSRSSLTPAIPVTGGAAAAAAQAATPATPPGSGAAAPRTPAHERGAAVNGTPEERRAAAPMAEGSPGNGGGVSDLLPKLGSLAGSGYSLEPPLRQLQAAAASDPESLSAVVGFTLLRRGVGSLRWLVPVDVRSLQLDAIARIDPGEVAVYVEAPKPPVGSELNTHCEVTLLNVFKKKGGQVVTDPMSVAAFEKRLRRYCAESGAEFVAYKPDGGVWRFRVEHFSRYGVPMDEDEEDVEEEGQGPHRDGHESEGAKAQGQGQGRRLGASTLAGDSDLDEATVDEDAGASEGAGAAVDSFMGLSEDDTMMAASEDKAAHLHQQQQQQQQQQQEQEQYLFDEQGLRFGSGADAGDAGGGQVAAASTRKRGHKHAARPSLSEGSQWGPEDRSGEAEDHGQPLQRTLPALLALQPGQLAAMRDSFFRQGGAMTADAAGAEAVSAVALPGEHLGTFSAQEQDQQRRLRAPRHGLAAGCVEHNWARPRPALLQGTSPDASMLSMEAQLQPSSAIIVAGQSSPTRLAAIAKQAGPLLPLPPSASSSAAAAPAMAGTSNVCDAFLLMGRSFRVGFSPSGHLACPVNTSVVSCPLAPLVALSRVLPVAGVSPAASVPVAVDASPPLFAGGGHAGEVATLRRRTIAALEAHLSMSRQMGPHEDDDAADDAMQEQEQVQRQAGPLELPPRWTLMCNRRQLPRLVEQQVAALGRRGDTADGAVTHATELWQLVQVLFEHIEGEGGDDKDEGSEELEDGGSRVDDMSGGGDEFEGSLLTLGCKGRSTRLAAFKRRAALSHWLAAKAGCAVRDAVTAAATAGGQEAILWALLHLVAGHQLGPAAALAAAAGDVRLAVLLSTAGRHGGITADLAKQLQVWHSAGLWRDHFSQPRKLLLAVLSGRMGEAAAALELDWPRALGLALWYSTPQTEGLGAALQVYESALAGPSCVSGVPPPVPPHADDPAAALRTAPSGGVPVASDAQYELLLLAARGARGAGPGLVARLLRAAGRSTNPLDATPGWVLASTLGALEELPDTDAAGDPDPVRVRLALDAVQQLLLMASDREASAVACWSVYVLLHLTPSLASNAERRAAVRSVLELTVPQWSEDSWAQDFLTNKLGLPLSWLEMAQAVWAGYLGRHEVQLDHLLGAGDAEAAHTLFCSHVAPSLFLQATASSVQQLASLAERLAGVQGAIGPSWASGGCLYLAWCRIFVRQDASDALWRRDVGHEAVAIGESSQATESCNLLAQQLVAAMQSGNASAARRAVLARMGSDVSTALAKLGSSAQAAAGADALMYGAVGTVGALLQQGCALVGSQQPILLAGLAAQLAM